MHSKNIVYIIHELPPFNYKQLLFVHQLTDRQKKVLSTKKFTCRLNSTFYEALKFFEFFSANFFATTPNSEVIQNLHKITKNDDKFAKIFQNWSFPYFNNKSFQYLFDFLRNRIFLGFYKMYVVAWFFGDI